MAKEIIEEVHQLVLALMEVQKIILNGYEFQEGSGGVYHSAVLTTAYEKLKKIMRSLENYDPSLK